MQKGDIILLSVDLQKSAKTQYKYALIEDIDDNGNVIAYFIEDNEAKGKRIISGADLHGHLYSFSLYDIAF